MNSTITTSCRSLTSATPRSAAICGKAGSIASMEKAMIEVITAIKAMNSKLASWPDGWVDWLTAILALGRSLRMAPIACQTATGAWCDCKMRWAAPERTGLRLPKCRGLVLRTVCNSGDLA